MMHRNTRDGFVLLTTIMVMALAILIAVALARQSMLLAAQAHDAQVDLQRRWGAFSCQRVGLENAPTIFENWIETGVPGEPIEPAANLETSFLLGGLRFTLRFGDEDAKVNLNTCLIERGSGHVKSVVRGLSSVDGPSKLQVDIRPESTNSSEFTQTINSWGQVFSFDRPPTGYPIPGLIQSSTEKITCWGSGRLNYIRAPEDVFLEVCKLAVGPRDADRLQDLRFENPLLNLQELLILAELREDDVEKLNELMAENSTCYSLWVTIEGSHRQWYELHVSSMGSADEEENPGTEDEQNPRTKNIRTHQFRW